VEIKNERDLATSTAYYCSVQLRIGSWNWSRSQGKLNACVGIVGCSCKLYIDAELGSFWHRDGEVVDSRSQKWVEAGRRGLRFTKPVGLQNRFGSLLFHQKPSKIKETTVFFQNLNYKFYEQKLINRSVFN
jgi:hypothetical protein